MTRGMLEHVRLDDVEETHRAGRHEGEQKASSDLGRTLDGGNLVELRERRVRDRRIGPREHRILIFAPRTEILELDRLRDVHRGTAHRQLAGVADTLTPLAALPQHRAVIEIARDVAVLASDDMREAERDREDARALAVVHLFERE